MPIVMKKTNYFLSLKLMSIKFFLLCSFFLAIGVSSLVARDIAGDRAYPYSLGAGLEMNLNTREGLAMGYGAGLDRYFLYIKDRGVLLAGVKAAMETDFSGISGTEVDLYLRMNLFKLGPGSIFTQVSWGFCSYAEDEIQVRTMHTDFTVGYRFFFLRGFYIEPYVRTGFPFIFGAGIMAGHWFSF